jgi:periplasmic copper chaperone A
MTRRHAATILAAALAFAAAANAAHAADVTLAEAWTRPAAEGQPASPLYVDITSTRALTLVDAKSPLAEGAGLRTTDIDAANKPTIRPVPKLQVAAGGTTRLAPRGPFIELRGIKRQLMTGDRIPVTLVFRGADGSKVTADTEALVRGISLRPVPGTAPAASGPGATAAPPVAAPTTAPSTAPPPVAAPTTAAPTRPGG